HVTASSRQDSARSHGRAGGSVRREAQVPSRAPSSSTALAAARGASVTGAGEVNGDVTGGGALRGVALGGVALGGVALGGVALGGVAGSVSGAGPAGADAVAI